MIKLKRVYEAAEEEGRNVEEIALERYGVSFFLLFFLLLHSSTSLDTVMLAEFCDSSGYVIS